MQMIDALPAVLIAVHDQAVAVFSQPLFTGQSLRRTYQGSQQGGLFWRDIIEGGIVMFGNDQQVHRGLWEQVFKCDDMLILINNISVYVVLSNFTKYAISHRDSPDSEA